MSVLVRPVGTERSEGPLPPRAQVDRGHDHRVGPPALPAGLSVPCVSDVSCLWSFGRSPPTMFAVNASAAFI